MLDTVALQAFYPLKTVKLEILSKKASISQEKRKNKVIIFNLKLLT